MGRLAGRVAVITGAGRGIGAATASRFAAEGARLALNDIDADAVEQVRAAVEAAGGTAVAVPGDVADAEVAARLHAAAVAELGGVDVVVANAGTTADAAFHALDADSWDLVYRACVLTTVAVVRAWLPALRDRVQAELAEHGRVAYQRKLTTTAAATYLTGNPGQANVTAAGGAVVGLTRTLARELGSLGVNVNAVAPGFIDTRLTAPQPAGGGLGQPEPVRQMTKAMTALGRHGTPEDVAAVHLFLASSDADFVSGITLPVAGGLLGTCT